MAALAHRRTAANPSTGVKLVLGIRDGKSTVQSVLFLRSEWGESQARAWLREHGFNAPAVDETYAYWRFRQASPSKFKSFRTIEANPKKKRNLFGLGGQSFSAAASKAAYSAGLKSGDTGLFDKWFSKSKWADDNGLRSSLRREYERGFEAEHERTIKARKSSSSSETTRRTSKATTPKTFKGYRIWADESGDWHSDFDRGSSFDSEGDVKRLITAMKSNPALHDALKGTDKQLKKYFTDSDVGAIIRKLTNPKKRNPQDSAADKFEEFHGAPSEETLVFEEQHRYHENLAVLGELGQLRVETVTGLDATLNFGGYDDKTADFDADVPLADHPMLATNEDGTQLYVVGGDTELDLAGLNMDSEKMVKDAMVIGICYEVTYQTQKGFDNFEKISYFHNLGEESGDPPTFIYDNLNKTIGFAGGQYMIKPELGDARGKGGSLFD